MFGLAPSYIPLLLLLGVLVVWYRAFGRNFSILALLVLVWMLGWAIFAIGHGSG